MPVEPLYSVLIIGCRWTRLELMIDRRRFLQGTTLWALGPIIGHAACEDVLSRFDDDSTAADVTLGPDLRGKTAWVTGVNSGIGYETMRVLALRGAHVLGTARTIDLHP